MLQILNQKLKCLYLRLGWPIRRRSKHKKVVIKKLGKSYSRTHHDHPKEASNNTTSSAVIHPSSEFNGSKSEKPIRIATFNAALFSMAPAVPKIEKKSSSFDLDNEDLSLIISKPEMDYDLRAKSMNDRLPRSILKQSPLHSSSMREEPDSLLTKQRKFARSKLRVSINLPDNEISLRRILKENAPAPLRSTMSIQDLSYGNNSTRTVVEVLRELNADILGLQDVKAEEEKGMQPLSDLAAALGMNYVFAESWAPEYGNAILSRYPIKKWKAQKIVDDADFRNVLKATIDVPNIGEFNFYCTHLDHLDENWRMKQIDAIIQSTDAPHILAGGLNSLEETDYSPERWIDIVKYYEEMGKPTPKFEVMKHLKSKQYTDAKDFAGECESVVMIAKGQSVQGTCKYGTRVDYILSSPSSPYMFVPGSYSVFSSKGTSDHHIVKVDVIKNVVVDSMPQQYVHRMKRPQRVVSITHSSPANAIWKTEE
ncbi:hypothetical protein ACH5RR_020113 [Cinchona calisaya]|uniref:Endonuclease/exonuclease/phosphatase domain-containing protein n=1 Tax=Cinchona calisaya TaxID=153742 RepID=A0ABD2ZES0_9GENT